MDRGVPFRSVGWIHCVLMGDTSGGIVWLQKQDVFLRGLQFPWDGYKSGTCPSRDARSQIVLSVHPWEGGVDGRKGGCMLDGCYYETVCYANTLWLLCNTFEYLCPSTTALSFSVGLVHACPRDWEFSRNSQEKQMRCWSVCHSLWGTELLRNSLRMKWKPFRIIFKEKRISVQTNTNCQWQIP